jgi:CBS domain-containing protein
MQQYVQLKAKDVSRRPVTLEPTSTLGDARNTMLRYNISRIVVAKGSKPVGIVTEKSIDNFLYKDRISRSLDEIRLDQAMQTNLITVTEDTDIKTCAQLMLDNQISSLIVLDGNGNLTGIFTKTDLTEVYSKYYESGNLVEDYMTAKVFTVVPSHSIHTVLATMVRNKISRIVVVRGQKPVGIVTTRDLLPISRLIEAEIVGMPSEVAMARRQTTPLFSGLSHVLLARDVMTRDPITVTGDSGLADAAHLMVNNRISGFPVVDSDDNLIGIVTKTDVVRALAAN